MANAGGAWDNAKKVVEVELKAKGTPLHDATRGRRHRRRSLQGHLLGRDEPDHQVHDALRPPRRRARDQDGDRARASRSPPSFLAVALFFVYRSFYGMRIQAGRRRAPPPRARRRTDGDDLGEPWRGADRSAGPRAALARACAALKVFPLHGVAVLPGTPTPFHIFEPRYKALVKDALAGDRVLAVPSLLTKADAHAAPAAAPADLRRRPHRGGAALPGRALRHRRPRRRPRAPRRGASRAGRPLPRVQGRDPRGRLARAADPPRSTGELEALRQIVYELSTRLPAESGAPQLAEAVVQMRDPSRHRGPRRRGDGLGPRRAPARCSRSSTSRRASSYVMEEVAGVVLVLSRGKNPRV